MSDVLYSKTAEAPFLFPQNLCVYFEVQLKPKNIINSFIIFSQRGKRMVKCRSCDRNLYDD